MAVVERTIGTVVANTTVQVTAAVQGVIDSAYFKEGQFVKKGDLLFQIDPRAFQALAQARAQLAKDQAQLAKRQQREALQIALRPERDLAPAARRGVATAAGRAIVEADKAAVNMAELNLGYTQIRSPVDGKTGPILIQPGNMVVGQRHHPARHHQPDPADQDFLLAAAVRPAAHPGAGQARTA